MKPCDKITIDGEAETPPCDSQKHRFCSLGAGRSG